MCSTLKNLVSISPEYALGHPPKREVILLDLLFEQIRCADKVHATGTL
ncbi:hypothetical protein XCR1_1930001 [Xenorhabdus cabanillasii JM26]|uniref:Uncharacterized protein n=1 Tax=Xenorhabdus cabanillasii JM26 TaxID=1427517 RepID=W1J363_9GAMM|nr:hypothetical protein XCR1_1930001 [Xenorhabdus cabanillasii JM26]